MDEKLAIYMSAVKK
jgi:cation transport regulator ChaC